MPYAPRIGAQFDSQGDVVVDDMRFLTSEKLGPNQSETPEGFLLIENTPVARCGWQIYAPSEIPENGRFAAPPDGVFRVLRTEDEVFSPQAMASANGKPVVNDHPDELVTPDTHQGVPGVALDPRRGTGAEADMIVMDLLIYNKGLIEAIKSGKREISLGYDVDYEELEPGRLAQRNIRINHIALVESGRCGPRCSISDHSPESPTPPEKELPMAKTKKKGASVFDRLRTLLSASTSLTAKDKEELEKALGEGENEMDAEPEGNSIAIHNHMPAGGAEHDDDPAAEGGMEERVARLETAVHELAEMCQASVAGGTSDEEKEKEKAWKESVDTFMKGKAKDDGEGEMDEAILGQLELETPPGAEKVADMVKSAKDSAFMSDSFGTVRALADIIAPGIRIPAFDTKLHPRKGFKVICDLRRSALDLAYAQPDTRGYIEEVLSGRPFEKDKMSCDAVRSTFVAVAAMKKGANNRTMRVADTLETRSHGTPVGKGIQNLTQYGEMLKKHYA